MFPTSPVKVLNQHTCKRKPTTVQWYLVVDRFEFHVYVAAVIHKRGEPLQVRMDFHPDSTLTFRKFVFDSLEQCIPIGTSKGFCKLCIQEALHGELGTYHLFSLNCRTSSYLILTEVMGFPHDEVYANFNRLHILCGLQPLECLSLDSLHQYIAYRRENEVSCALL
jgi:hypothetical protein